MHLFYSFVLNILPLYIAIITGYTAGRFITIDKQSIALLLFYVITPLVFFYSAAQAPIDFSIIFLFALIFCISSIICIIFYFIGNKFWQDSTKNILAFSAGNANTGYFGLPVALQIFDEQHVGIYVVAMMGISIYEYTVGFFVTVYNGNLKNGLMRIVKLPILYAFLFAIILSKLNLKIPDFLTGFFVPVRNTYTILGMMIIGLSLADIKSFKIDFKFILAAFSAKFIFWPGIIISLIFLDIKFFHIYNSAIYKVCLLIAIMPLATNVVVIANVLKTCSEKAAAAVLLGVIAALFYVPFIVTKFIL